MAIIAVYQPNSLSPVMLQRRRGRVWTEREILEREAGRVALLMRWHRLRRLRLVAPIWVEDDKIWGCADEIKGTIGDRMSWDALARIVEQAESADAFEAKLLERAEQRKAAGGVR